MRGHVQFALTVLVALLLFIAPAQGLLCQQACALCIHAPVSKTAVMAQHCMDMAMPMAPSHESVLSSTCCNTGMQAQPAVLAAASADVNVPSGHLSTDTSLLPVQVLAISSERAAPPGVVHPPVVALRV